MLACIPGKIAGQVVWIHGLHANGLGKDIWTLTPHEISWFTFYLLIMSLLYNSLMTLLKIAFCLFYLSIFSGVIVRRVLWATMAFHTLCGIIVLTIQVFSCIPISFAWEKYSTATRGRCINTDGLYWAWAAITVASDLWMLAIPLSQVIGLKIYWKKKISAIAMFSTGFL